MRPPRLPITLALASGMIAAHAQTRTLTTANCPDPANATACIQGALDDPTVTRVVLSDVGQPWITDGLLIQRDGITLELAGPTVTLRPAPGALTEFESLVNVVGRADVTIDGNGGTFLLDKENYATNSEFRHGVNTNGSTRLTIRDLTIRRAPGDGILVGPRFVPDVNDADGDGDVTDFEPTQPSRDVTIANVTCDANNRQGISVTSVIGLAVTGSRFVNTAGTEPEAGVDFEPFRRYQPMQGVVFRDCEFAGNAGAGLLYGGVDVNASTPPAEILLEDCRFRENGQNDAVPNAGITIRNTYNPFGGADQTGREADRSSSTGTLTFRRVLVRDEPKNGINVRQYAAGLDVLFEDVTLVNVANEPFNALSGPILIQPPRYDDANASFPNDPCYGGATFRNVRVRDDQTDRRQLTVDDLRSAPNTGVRDVTGDICYELVGAAAGEPIATRIDQDICGDFNLTVSACASPVPATLTGFAARPDGAANEVTWAVETEEGVGSYVVERSGSGDNGDYRDIGRRAAAGPGSYAFTDVSPTQRAYYRLRIEDVDGGVAYSTVAVVERGEGAGLRLSPNPTTGLVRLLGAGDVRAVTVSDASGRRHVVAVDDDRIDLSLFPAGVYVVRVGAEAVRVVRR